jgi:hypothetical protein
MLYVVIDSITVVTVENSGFVAVEVQNKNLIHRGAENFTKK